MKTRKIICKSQVRAVEDVVDAWRPDHRSAVQGRDVEDIVRLCLFVREEFRRWFNDLWDCARAGTLASPQAEGEILGLTLDQALEVIPRVSPLVAWAEEAGYSVAGSEAFGRALEDLRTMKNDLGARWPFVDPEQVQRSRAAFARGDFQSAEDVLRELQGSDLQ